MAIKIIVNVLLINFYFYSLIYFVKCDSRPNIIVLMVDDLGNIFLI